VLGRPTVQRLVQTEHDRDHDENSPKIDAGGAHWAAGPFSRARSPTVTDGR